MCDVVRCVICKSSMTSMCHVTFNGVVKDFVFCENCSIKFTDDAGFRSKREDDKQVDIEPCDGDVCVSLW